MLRIFEECDATNAVIQRWATFYKYDTSGRLIWVAHPSAVSLPTNLSDLEQDPNTSASNRYDLMRGSSGNYQYVADSAGLIDVYDYHTTGTIAGELKTQYVRNGDTGANVAIRAYEYETHAHGGQSVDRVTKVTEYPVAGNTTTKNETSFAYVLHTNSTAVQQMTTTYPIVPTNMNGSGTADVTVAVFDVHGRQLWAKDARGFVTRSAYDLVTGRMTQRIDDADTAQTTDEPSGWTTPSGGGLHLVTDYAYDELGRLTEVLSPTHTAQVGSTPTAVRRASWMVYKEALSGDETWSGTGYRSGASNVLIDPVSITFADKAGRTTDAIVAKRSTGSGKLASTDTFARGAWQRWSKMTYNDRGQLTASRVYHTIPASGDGTSGTNYDERTQCYDAMGRQQCAKTPRGTVTRTVYDARGFVDSVWVGTDETGATNANPAGTGAPNNMVKVSSNTYGTDGTLATTTTYAGASDTRVTAYGHDWRNRLTSIDGEIDQYVVNQYDNLGRATRTESRNTSAIGNLTGSSETLYDPRGRVYQSTRYSVDPSTGAEGVSLVGRTWYDPAGNVAKSIAPGAGITASKASYDGLGRVTRSYLGYDASETTYAAALDVSGDTIVSQSDVTYDGQGCVTQTATAARLHDASGTGALTSSTARISYTASWCDGIGRPITSAA